MIHLKSEKEIDLMREAARLVSATLAEVAKHLEPGVETGKLDVIAYDFIRSNDATPSFKGYGPRSNPFPASLCISVNEEIIHGLPGKRKLIEGDIVSIDCGVYKNGFHGDHAYTFQVGEISDEALALLQTTHEATYRAAKQAIHGNKTGDIGFAVQDLCESKGYGVVRDFTGHGLGKSLHEDPSVPNYGKSGKGVRLRSGMVLAIEPMITLGTHKVKMLNDGWTVVTADNSLAAHFEHDVVVRENESEILSDYSLIEEVTKLEYSNVSF